MEIGGENCPYQYQNKEQRSGKILDTCKLTADYCTSNQQLGCTWNANLCEALDGITAAISAQALDREQLKSLGERFDIAQESIEHTITQVLPRMTELENENERLEALLKEMGPS